jgi:general secretion pathway protein D
MMTVIDKLDIRRAQVLVEAIIVEVSAEKTAELGITWAMLSDGNLAAVTDFPGLTNGVSSLAGALADDAVVEAGSVIADGINLGLGRISDSGTSWVGLIQALEADADSNIMATPTLVTLDNEEAEINVGQEVPFVTGSFSNTGSAGGAVNPFQTIEREQVGLTLKITPQINEGDAVLLEIDQEISSVLPSTEAVDLVTSNRTVTTTVIVDDGDTLVLGGLLQDELQETEQRVPVLGSIPLIGALFRATKTEMRKTNLMIFIRPTILRDSVATSFVTNEKYQFIREWQLAEQDRDRRLFPDLTPPTLPELEDTTSTESRTIDLRELPALEASPEIEDAEG